MRIHCLEQTGADVPAGTEWLGFSELQCLAGLRFEKRRADWRLGRWTAKRALAAYLQAPYGCRDLATIEIRPAPSGAPEVFLDDRPAGMSISLSHRSGVALCAIASSGVALGCDLELVEPRSKAFCADYFTSEEQELIARASPVERSQLVALLWSAKESALKTLRCGLRLDTRRVVVRPDLKRGAVDWRPLCVDLKSERSFHGWWRATGDMLRTVVADQPTLPPIYMTVE